MKLLQQVWDSMWYVGLASCGFLAVFTAITYESFGLGLANAELGFGVSAALVAVLLWAHYMEASKKKETLR